MELKWKACLRVGVTVVLLFLVMHYWTAFTGLVGVALGAAKPLFWGCAIAYVVNIPMNFLERHIEPKCKKEVAKKLCRPICMVLAFLCIFLIAVLIVQMRADWLSSNPVGRIAGRTGQYGYLDGG